MAQRRQKPQIQLYRATVQVDLLALIERYSTENGVQLNCGQQSLMDLGTRPDVNWDPVMVVLIAHFFDGMPDEDIEKLPAEQKQAIKTVKQIANAVTGGDMNKHFINVCEAQAQGKSKVLTLDPAKLSALLGDSAEVNATMAKNPQFMKAMKMIQDAKEQNKALKQDELATIFALLGGGLNITPDMWQHATDNMVKKGKIAIEDQKILLAKVVKANRLTKVEEAIGDTVKCMGSATGAPGMLTLTKDPKLTATAESYARKFSGHTGYFGKALQANRPQFVERQAGPRNPMRGGR